MFIPKKVAVLFSILGVTAGAAGAIAFQTHAATSTTTSATQTTAQNNFRTGTPPAAAGTVTAVSNNTLTVADKRTGTSYTVDTTNATLQKTVRTSGQTTPPTRTTITTADVQVGDNVMVEGTVSGNQITATKVMDGLPMGGHGGFGHGAMGTVSAINGNTITLTGQDGTTYTVNAGSALVKKVSTSSISEIAVGDTLQVNGTTSGTTITAEGIVDGELHAPTAAGQ